MTPRLTTAALALALAGCGAAPPLQTGLTPYAAACNPDPASETLKGRPGNDSLGQEALRITGGAEVRWIRPGQATPLDYNPDRLNIELNPASVTTGFRCG